MRTFPVAKASPDLVGAETNERIAEELRPLVYIPRMLVVRGIVFTILIPGAIAVVVPATLNQRRVSVTGWLSVGWIPILIGAVVYGTWLLRFLASGGTPAIFFTRDLKFVIGEEPSKLVQEGLYRYSRNPMYLGVLMVIFGQAIAFGSINIAPCGLVLFLIFHLVVVLVEEPHLERHRPGYDEYRRRVPRWIGFPS